MNTPENYTPYRELSKSKSHPRQVFTRKEVAKIIQASIASGLIVWWSIGYLWGSYNADTSKTNWNISSERNEEVTLLKEVIETQEAIIKIQETIIQYQEEIEAEKWQPKQAEQVTKFHNI